MNRGNVSRETFRKGTEIRGQWTGRRAGRGELLARAKNKKNTGGKAPENGLFSGIESAEGIAVVAVAFLAMERIIALSKLSDCGAWRRWNRSTQRKPRKSRCRAGLAHAWIVKVPLRGSYLHSVHNYILCRPVCQEAESGQAGESSPKRRLVANLQQLDAGLFADLSGLLAFGRAGG